MVEKRRGIDPICSGYISSLSDSSMQGGYDASAKPVLLVASSPQSQRTLARDPIHALPSRHVAPQKKEHANLQCHLTLAGTLKEAAGEYVSQ